MKSWESTGREHAREILQAALKAATPQTILRNRVRHEGGALRVGDETVRLEGRKVRVAAVGKAARPMAAQSTVWGPFEEAVLVAPRDEDVPGFESHPGTHPLPSASSVKAGERVLRLAEATQPGDLLILLLSGGGSALAEAPAVPLEDLQRTTDLLMKAGADIQELNTVRKHLSKLKGGYLARACKGDLLVLSISDVAGDDPSAIASGPASPDPTTFGDALRVLKERDLWDAAPASVRDHLQAGADGKVPETLKPGDEAAKRVSYHVIAGNEDALDAAAEKARDLGYEVRVEPETLKGEARDAGEDLARQARDMQPGTALLRGGETTVVVRGDGKGGRNQEAALAAVEAMGGVPAVIACFGTDGIDGPTDAAGAIVDGLTLARARKADVDPREHLENNDAYHFFQALDDLLMTGPTGTNVRDVALVLRG